MYSLVNCFGMSVCFVFIEVMAFFSIPILIEYDSVNSYATVFVHQTLVLIIFIKMHLYIQLTTFLLETHLLYSLLLTTLTRFHVGDFVFEYSSSIIMFRMSAIIHFLQLWLLKKRVSFQKRLFVCVSRCTIKFFWIISRLRIALTKITRSILTAFPQLR